MALTWEPNPDDANVVDVVPEKTEKGFPCQLHVELEFTKEGTPVGKRKLVVNDGYLRDRVPKPEDWEAEEVDPSTGELFKQYHKELFAKIFADVPAVSQAVKDGMRARLTNKMLREVWRGRKVDEQKEGE